MLINELCVAVHLLFSSAKLVIKFCFFSSLYPVAKWIYKTVMAGKGFAFL